MTPEVGKDENMPRYAGLMEQLECLLHSEPSFVEPLANLVKTAEEKYRSKSQYRNAATKENMAEKAAWTPQPNLVNATTARDNATTARDNDLANATTARDNATSRYDVFGQKPVADLKCILKSVSSIKQDVVSLSKVHLSEPTQAPTFTVYYPAPNKISQLGQTTPKWKSWQENVDDLKSTYMTFVPSVPQQDSASTKTDAQKAKPSMPTFQRKASPGHVFGSSKRYDIGLSACFRQWRATHSHCAYLHGYDLIVSLFFETDRLNSLNWVVDFGGLKPLKEQLQTLFDHKCVVAADDPLMWLFELMYQHRLIDLIVLPAVGCEAFARHIFEMAQEWLPHHGFAHVKLTRVLVEEHGANSAWYGVSTDNEFSQSVLPHLDDGK